VGLKPFGLEALRILLLEKGRIILSQDTEATLWEAGLEGLVALDKPFFLGREALLRHQERGPRSRLAGFRMDDKTQVPADGCPVVEQGQVVGRVASARFSPTLQQSIGQA